MFCNCSGPLHGQPVGHRGPVAKGFFARGFVTRGFVAKGCIAKGFSLVELIVVIVIIGMLASLVAFRTRSYLIVSKQNAAKLDISRIVQAVDTYYATHDHYPSNESGLEVLTTKDALFADGILKAIPLDPWKHPYQYNSPGADSAYEVICLGADNREGGEGPNRDLSNDDLDRRAD